MADSQERRKRSSGSRMEQMLVQYTLKEIRKGRDLASIMADPYVTNRTSDLERQSLLDRTEIIEAVGEDAAARIRSQMS